MAGDWIKVEVCLPDKPEVVELADLLQIDQDSVVGKLVRLWAWADQHTLDGNAAGVTRAFVDRITNCDGFAGAMKIVGWISLENDRFILPNFGRHNGETAKARALTAKRAAKHRNAKSNGHGVTSALPREEKRRSSLGVPKEESPLPPSLDTPEFAGCWKAWRTHRKEIGKPLRPTSEAASLKKLAKIGLSRAIATVEHTLEKGWQGLREPDGLPAAIDRTPTDEDLANWNSIDGGLGAR